MHRFLIILFVFASLRIYSQAIASNPIGPISDIPSNFGSSGIIVEKLLLKEREETTEKRTQDFLKEYKKRLLYYGGAAWLSTVNDIINNVRSRYHKLRQENEKLSFLFYSRKKENRMYLLSADRQIENMSSHFLNGEINTIMGEKFNLYENIRGSLSAINRELDKVDNNVKESNLKRKIVRQFVK